MAYFWESDFYKSGKGTDLWDIASMGLTTEGAKDFYGGVKDFAGDAWNDVTGVTGARSAKDAAKLQVDAADRANQQMLQIYNQNREDMMPWLDSGKANLGLLDKLLYQGYFSPENMRLSEDELYADPSYLFRVGEGAKMMNRNAAARGGLRSGATDVELMDLGQRMGSQEYSNAYNRKMGGMDNFFNKLALMSGRGQTQSQSMGNMGSQFGVNSGNVTMGGANAAASGIIGAANAQQQGTMNLLNLLMQGGALAFG